MSRHSDESRQRKAFQVFLDWKHRADATGDPGDRRAADGAYDLFLRSYLNDRECEVADTLRELARLRAEVHLARARGGSM